MEKKRNQKQHDKHHKHHKPPPDAYEIYEYEHRQRWIPTARVDSSQFEETSSPKAENRIAVDYWPMTEDSTDEKRSAYYEDVDAEAEDFIGEEHEKFKRSKWLSMKGYFNTYKP